MAVSSSYVVEMAAVAQGDLQAIVEFIAADDPGAARRVLDQLATSCAALKKMPERGRVVPELAAVGLATYRELVVSPWRVIYRISGLTVFVLAVVDGRRNLEDLLLARVVRG
jgi:plasmid stabilization system protein ParE